tara:strand:+ start:78 stop:335 length:258 start_codon:yes stop_codon:yes gene_type:complete
MVDIQGKNGANAYTHGGVEKNIDGSLTFSATISACTDILFQMQYMGYDFETSYAKFKEDLQAETDKYFVAIEFSQELYNELGIIK